MIKEAIVNRWIRNNVIEEEDRELYEYGIEITIEHFANLATCTFIALFIGEIFSYIAFIISFMQLRSYAGGIHATSFKKCYVYSNITVLISLLFIKYNLVNIWIYRGLSFVGLVYLCVSKLGETENRKISDKERKVYEKKKKLILMCLFIVSAVVYIIKLTEIEKGIESAIIISGLSVLINYIVCIKKQDG